MHAWHSINDWYHWLAPPLVALAVLAWVIGFVTALLHNRRRHIPQTITEIQLRPRPMPPSSSTRPRFSPLLS